MLEQRQRNSGQVRVVLTEEQLQQIAEERGVADLYRKLVEGGQISSLPPEICRQFNLDEMTVFNFLPTDRNEWKYYTSAPPEYSGYEGFFKNDQEVERFLQGIRRA